MEEEQVGLVTNFYVKISVAAIKVTSGVIRIGDTLHFKGHTTSKGVAQYRMGDPNIAI